jgi:hypothetical protein
LQDFRDYHLPLVRLHHAHFHGEGIARGLEVQGTLGSDTVVVQPGVAVDALGQLIALTQAATLFSSNFLNSTLYVTLKFAEGAGPDGRLAQVPEVRLQTVSSVEGGGAGVVVVVVLALVETDGNGRVAALKERDNARQFRRQLLGGQLEALEIRRAVQVGDQVAAVSAGRIEAGQSGGLQITVPGASDVVLVSRQDGGPTAQVELRATNVTIPGTLSIGGDVNVAGTMQGTLAPGLVGADQLTAQAVTNAKIADQAVTLNKIAPGVLPPDVGITVVQAMTHGQTIPIPRGFQKSDCVFFVAIKFLNIDPALGARAYNCGVDANGKVSTNDPGRVGIMGVAMAKRGGW